ncbi:hypothetical protein DL767_010490 [Monosporascus sp. MG133]|nr:hypothetical protein DL767_010490 [Monosporascus sp. MG133]
MREFSEVYACRTPASSAVGSATAGPTLLEDTASKIPNLVALGDDQTGTPTYHDVAVLKVWDLPMLIS